MATENVFTKAKRYQKSHPRTSWQDCIKACSGKKKKSVTVGRVKKSAPAKKVKVKLKKNGTANVTIGAKKERLKKYKVSINSGEKYVIVRARTAEDARQKAKREHNAWGATTMNRISGTGKAKRKKSSLTFSLSGISMAKLDQELRHCESLQENLARHKAMLKEKGQTATEKNDIRRDIKKLSAAISNSKRHIAALKRSI